MIGNVTACFDDYTTGVCLYYPEDVCCITDSYSSNRLKAKPESIKPYIQLDIIKYKYFKYRTVYNKCILFILKLGFHKSGYLPLRIRKLKKNKA